MFSNFLRVIKIETCRSYDRLCVKSYNLLVLFYQLITHVKAAVLETTFKHVPTCVDI